MSRLWYLAILVPLAIGGVVAVLAFSRLIDHVEGMHRLVVPGEKTVMLDAGDYKIFAESESHVDGTAYVNDHYSVRCSLTSNGTPIALDTPTGRTRYTMGGYSGRAIFTFTMPHDSNATLACTSEGGQGVLAIGSGIGGGIVLGVISLLFGIFGAGGVFTIVFLRRRKFVKAAAAR